MMARTWGARAQGVGPLDPLEVFRLMIETGSRNKTARQVGFSNSNGLVAAACRQADRGQPALYFALDAGMWLYQSRRSQQLAGIEPRC